MKNTILSIATVIALTAAGTLVAQAPQNTTAPGATTQQEPGQTNNNLPNPGNPQTNLNQNSGTAPTTGTTPSTTTTTQDRTGQEQDEVDVRQGTTPTTGTMATETEQGEGMDVDVDTGANAQGAVDVDVNSTTDADTDASGIDETGSLDNEQTNTGAYADQDTLPETAGEMPTVALLGLIALASAFALRRVRA